MAKDPGWCAVRTLRRLKPAVAKPKFKKELKIKPGFRTLSPDFIHAVSGQEFTYRASCAKK
jgi:hypothetical protein